MQARLSYFWEELRSNLWFLPGILTFAAIGLSYLTISADQAFGQRWVERLGWLWAGGSEGAREVLSTIAGSMITVAGVVFSITIVALTLASSQFGPRLLRNFIRDPVNQWVLGTFIATFIYSLLILRTVRSVDGLTFVPYISVTTALILAVLSLAVLIYFIHHLSESIQADFLCAAVARELMGSIDTLYPEKLGKPAQTPPALPEGRWGQICVAQDGYIQALDLEELMQVAQQHDVIIQMVKTPGDFISAGEELARIWPASRQDDHLASKVSAILVVAEHRTPVQDVEYAMHQLVEIAVRALSPGINDPFTAMICLDWLGAALGRLTQRSIPSPCRLDQEGQLRIITGVSDFNTLSNTAFNQIRQYGRSSVSVSLRMLSTITTLADRIQRPEDRDALLRHARLVRDDALENQLNEWDREQIVQRYQEAVRRLHHGGVSGGD